jgi:hypothetical protein
MKMRMVFVLACLGSLILITNAYGQAGQRRLGDLPFSRDPCPGGSGIGIIDEVSEAFTIEDLIQSSELVIKGTVVRVLPSEVINKNHPNVIYTTSVISIDEVLRGAPPPSNTIAIVQLGGRVPPCTFTVKDSPLVELREEYIFFLVRDPTTEIPNNSGSPRYATLGQYGGKAKIVDGKIQFNPSAHELLRQYDNMDLAMFKDILKRGVDVRKLRPVDKPRTPIPPPGKTPIPPPGKNP